jgi:hypothetical protein
MGLLDGTGGYSVGMTPQQQALQDNWGLSGQTSPFPMQPAYVVKPTPPGPPPVPGAGGSGAQQGGGFGAGLPAGTGTNGQTNGFSSLLAQLLGIAPDSAATGGANGAASSMAPAASGAASSGAASGAASGAGADAAGGAGAAGASGWIVCTELHRQGKMPTHHWIHGARVFVGYSEVQKRAYYFFAIPAVFHLRRHPDSYLSRLLRVVFCARAEHIAAGKGCRDARKTVLGAIVTHGLPIAGAIIGTLFVRKPQDFSVVYREAAR